METEKETNQPKSSEEEKKETETPQPKQKTKEEQRKQLAGYLHAKLKAAQENRKRINEERQVKTKDGRVIPGAKKNIVVKKKTGWDEKQQQESESQKDIASS